MGEAKRRGTFEDRKATAAPRVRVDKASERQTMLDMVAKMRKEGKRKPGDAPAPIIVDRDGYTMVDGHRIKLPQLGTDGMIVVDDVSAMMSPDVIQAEPAVRTRGDADVVDAEIIEETVLK